MLFLVKLFPEMTIKSRPVRRRLTRLLRRNIKLALHRFRGQLRVRGEWDLIEVETDSPEIAPEVLEKLRRIPGIARILEVHKHRLPDFEGMLAIAKAQYGDALAGKTFAVRCKRSGRHSFRSVDVEVFVGAGLRRETAAAGVDLGNPEVLVSLEIRHGDLYLVLSGHPGLGGLPLGGQGTALSLVSGGFDSAVSSYLAMRRGVLTHFCFFSLGGDRHSLAVRELALYLWLRHHSSHRVKFVTVPFEDVVREILEKVDNPLMGVVLKRMMMRAADRIAAEVGAQALVTGESVAQVSSQTLANLAVIDSAAQTLVIRPLATMDKQRIIDLAREIGTEEFSRHIPEYCAVISDKPTTKARPNRIAREEARFDFALLEKALADASIQNIADVAAPEVFINAGDGAGELAVLAKPAPGDIVIDIRHESEQRSGAQPPVAANTQLLRIPFYRLSGEFDRLEATSRYLLYCERGMISRLHAAHLLDAGHRNIAVLDPE